MIVEMRHAQFVSVTRALRRVRRLFPLPFLEPRVGTFLAVAAVVAACGAGLWAGFVLSEIGVAPNTAAGAVVLVGLIAGTGSGAVWGEIRVGLVEPGSWWFFADRGVSPRTFIVGRHLVHRLVRFAAGGCLLITALLVLTITDDVRAPIGGAGWSAAMLAGVGAAACGVSFALLRTAPAPRRRGLVFVAILTIPGFTVSALSWTWHWVGSVIAQLRAGSGTSMQVDGTGAPTEALIIMSLAAVGVATSSYVALADLSWADINERAERIGQAASRRASRQGSRRRLAGLVLLDMRRGLRSFEWRVRPGLLTVLAMMLSIAVLGALAAWQFRDMAFNFSSSAVGATLVGGICAGYAFLVFSSFAPLVSLDSDRGALILMRTLPGGIRAIVVVRAWIGALVTAVSGATFIAMLSALVPMAPRSIGTAFAACVAVAVVAPVVSAFVSLRYPQADWKEAEELGQRGWARVLANYGAGMAIAVALSTTSAIPWTFFPSLAGLALLVVGAPLAAAAISAFLPTAIGTPAHARH